MGVYIVNYGVSNLLSYADLSTRYRKETKFSRFFSLAIISVFRMYARTLLGDKHVDELGFVLAHEHLKMNFDCSFRPSPYCNLPHDMPLLSMPLRNMAMVRRFPYHFRENLDFTDYDAVLESLKNYKTVGGGSVVEVSTVGLHRDPECCARLSQDSMVNVIMGTG